MVIMLIGLMGLFKSIEMLMEHNLRNYMREESVRLSEERMVGAKNLPFANISSYSTPRTVTRSFRSISKPFSVNRTVTALSTTSQQVDVSVVWTYKGATYTQQVSSIVAQ